MGLLLDVYRRAGSTMDCTNGGVSGAATTLCAVNVEGPFEPSDRHPAVLLVHGNVPNSAKVVPAVNAGTDEFPHWVPANPKAIGPMFGGNYADGDSRFSEAVGKITGNRFYGAVPIHDRFETKAEYDALSR